MPSIIPGYEYDIFISYRQKDNRFPKILIRPYLYVLMIGLLSFSSCIDKGPQPADFNISRIEGGYITEIIIQQPPRSDPTILNYFGTSHVSLIDDERFTISFKFGNAFSFPSITGIIAGKTIGRVDITAGGAYFVIEETDTLKGAAGELFVQTRDGNIIQVYGAFAEFGANKEKIGLSLILINKNPEFTRYDFQGTKN